MFFQHGRHVATDFSRSPRAPVDRFAQQFSVELGNVLFLVPCHPRRDLASRDCYRRPHLLNDGPCWSRRARIESLISAAVNWACSSEPPDIGALGFCAAKRMLFARLAGREWSVMRCD